MWSALQEILTSNNFWKTVIGIGALVILFAVLVKKGLISFKGHGLKVGLSNEDELAIVRTQIQWCEADCESMLREVTNRFSETEMNEYKARYTIERVLDELIKIVIFNHICLEPQYVKLKQDLVWSVVSSINPEPIWNNLEPIVKERVEVAIRTLYEIRMYYSKE